MHRYLPYELLSHPPSIFDGITKEREKEVRVIGIQFLRKLGHGLGFPYYTIATATVYYHYFFVFYSMKNYSYLVRNK